MLTLISSAYFAATLGVAGLAKINEPEHFRLTLRMIGPLPTSAIYLASVAIPCFEVGLAMFVLSGVHPVVAASINLGVFAIFLIIKTVMFHRRASIGCGCFGSLLRHKIDVAHLVASLVVVGLAILHLWLVMSTKSISFPIRFWVFSTLCAFALAILWRIVERRKPQSLAM
jgi:hypothetical protein